MDEPGVPALRLRYELQEQSDHWDHWGQPRETSGLSSLDQLRHVCVSLDPHISLHRLPCSLARHGAPFFGQSVVLLDWNSSAYFPGVAHLCFA